MSVVRLAVAVKLHLSVLVWYIAARGAIVAAVVLFLDIVFWKAVIIALVSGLTSGVGSIVAVYISNRQARANRAEIRETTRAVRETKQAVDKLTPDENGGR